MLLDYVGTSPINRFLFSPVGSSCLRHSIFPAPFPTQTLQILKFLEFGPEADPGSENIQAMH